MHELYAVHLRVELSDANKIPPPFVLATAAVREDIDASEIELLTVVCDDVIECLIMEE